MPVMVIFNKKIWFHRLDDIGIVVLFFAPRSFVGWFLSSWAQLVVVRHSVQSWESTNCDPRSKFLYPFTRCPATFVKCSVSRRCSRIISTAVPCCSTHIRNPNPHPTTQQHVRVQAVYAGRGCHAQQQQERLVRHPQQHLRCDGIPERGTDHRESVVLFC